MRDFWQVDDRTIVFVADPTFGIHSMLNIKHFFIIFSSVNSVCINFLRKLQERNNACFIGNILNFNVGALVDLDIPRSFWSRLSGKYGNMFYWKEKVVFVSFCA